MLSSNPLVLGTQVYADMFTSEAIPTKGGKFPLDFPVRFSKEKNRYSSECLNRECKIATFQSVFYEDEN